MKITNVILLVILLVLFGRSLLSMPSTPEKHNVSITVSSLSIDSSGHVIAVGVGEYITTQRNTKIDIRFQISPNNLRFEMWETNLGITDWITEGSHVGTISEDLKTINAVWTTTSSGEQGELFLRAK